MTFTANPSSGMVYRYNSAAGTSRDGAALAIELLDQAEAGLAAACASRPARIPICLLDLEDAILAVEQIRPGQLTEEEYAEARARAIAGRENWRRGYEQVDPSAIRAVRKIRPTDK